MLAKRVAFGAAWLVGGRIFTRGIDAVAMLVVARFLTPEDFGLVSLATAVLFVLTTISDLSISNALIRMKDPAKSAYDTAFTLGMLRGTLLAALLICLAFPYAAIYKDDRLVALLSVLALAPFIQGLVSPCLAAFARNLQYRPLVTREFLAKLSAFLASVTVAYMTESYWALIAGRLAAPAITVASSYVLAPYRPALSLKHWREVFFFGGWLTLSQTLNAVNYQSDRFIVGGALGSATLGQYYMGSELSAIPTVAPAQPMMQALYSGLAKFKDDKERMRQAYLTSQAMVTFIIFPLGFITSAVAYPLVDLALGPKWEIASYVISILAPVFALQSLSIAADTMLMARGETKQIFRRDVVAILLRVPAIFLGLAVAGLPGLVWGRAISGVVMTFVTARISARVIDVSPLHPLAAGWRSIMSATLSYAVIVLLYPYSTGHDGTAFQSMLYLVICCTALGSLYIALHFVLWLAAGKPVGPEMQILKFLDSRTKR